MLQAAVAFVAWISVIRFFLNLDFFRTEDLSAAYEHHIPNEREKKALLNGIFRFVVPMRHCTGRRSKVTDSQFDGAQKFVVTSEPQKPWGWDKFLMQEYVVLDIFCFCCTIMLIWEVGEKNQDHVQHNGRLDPSYGQTDGHCPGDAPSAIELHGMLASLWKMDDR